MKEQSVPQEHIISRSTNEEKVQTLWDRWTKYFDIGTTWRRAGSRKQNGALIRETGNSISLLRCFRRSRYVWNWDSSLTGGGDHSELDFYPDV